MGKLDHLYRQEYF